MAGWIEDYALVGDMQSAALIGRDGSVDWLCLPRFDSPAFFAALLGNSSHGQWRLGPADVVAADRRRYRGDTLILESEWDSADGVVRVTDFMPPRDASPNLVRIVECVHGRATIRSELRLRFDYGSIVPWVRREGDSLHAVAGPDSVWLHGPERHVGARDLSSFAEFDLAEGEQRSFVLTWHPSHEPEPDIAPAQAQLELTEQYWDYWMRDCTYDGPYREAVVRSLILLKALTFEPTGGIVAAATTSLPEDLGGVRNWDYRYCWLRDATLTLQALLRSGFTNEAMDWRNWLLRAIAGDPGDLQIMYGLAGERRLPEWVVDWLPGYEGSRPVRIGNAAVTQLQLDVYGEVLTALAVARASGLTREDNSWRLQVALLRWLEENWQQPDEGLWEVRGPRRQFTHSKVLVWAAFDAGVKAVEERGLGGRLDAWRRARDEVHEQVCREGYDAERNTFTQYYGSTTLDASLLLIAQLGFLPPEDPRFVGTVEAIQRTLRVDGGFVLRYDTDERVDGLPGNEGAFLACSFWLADALALIGRVDEARELFDKLVALRNDVGMLAEEYDARIGRQCGNVPQAFSHVALVNTAMNLSRGPVPARSDRGGAPPG